MDRIIPSLVAAAILIVMAGQGVPTPAEAGQIVPGRIQPRVGTKASGISRPDLETTGLIALDNGRPVDALHPGQHVDVNCKFLSKNMQIAKPFSVRFLVNGNILSEQVWETVPLGPNASAGISAQWTPGAGKHVVECIVDSRGEITEASEDNNRVTRSFLVSQPIVSTLGTVKNGIARGATTQEALRGALQKAGIPETANYQIIHPWDRPASGRPHGLPNMDPPGFKGPSAAEVTGSCVLCVQCSKDYMLCCEWPEVDGSCLPAPTCSCP